MAVVPREPLGPACAVTKTPRRPDLCVSTVDVLDRQPGLLANPLDEVPRSQPDASPWNVETMISSTRSSRTASSVAVYGSGCAIWPCASMPAPRSSRAHAAGGAPPRGAPTASGRSAATRGGSSPETCAARSRIRVRSGSPITVSFATTRTLAGACLLADIDDDVLDRQPPRRVAIRSRTFLRSQPDFFSGCVETTISVGRARAGPARRGSRRPDPRPRRARARRCRPPAAHRACGRAGGPRPPVACPRRRRSPRSAGHGTEDRDEVDAVLGAPRQRVDEPPPGNRLVRHDEHVRSSCASLDSARPRDPRSGRVTGAGHAVLVRVADHLRDLVEVEDRRRRRHLPLERKRAPWVRLGDRAARPARRSCCRRRR